MIELKEGSRAPMIDGIDQNGNNVKLADFYGKKIVLFFYPKDDTPTCTAEACNIRDNYDMLLQRDFVVLGVSADDEKSHRKFAKKFGLTFPLIADTSKKIINDYGVWGEKTLYGKTFMGIIRTTFLIDEKGNIEKILNKVDSANHTEQILNLYNQ